MNSPNDRSANGATWWQAALMIRGQTKAEQRNLRWVWTWCLIWAASFIVAATVVAALQLQGWSAWLLATLPIVLSIPAMLAQFRFIREADEFMRKVQFEGIAIGFAAGLLFCFGYQSLELFGAPKLPLITATVPLGLGWAIGSFIVAYRHR